MTEQVVSAALSLVATPPAFGIAGALVLFYLLSAVKDKKTRIWGQHVAIFSVVGCMVWWGLEIAVTRALNVYKIVESCELHL